MIYGFADFELDGRAVELRRAGVPVAMEPQVFALLLLLVENRERMVSKDEIIEKVWDGRIVSDSALTSRVKSARAALGDDGKTQKYIRTVHGQGFRFSGEVREIGIRIVPAASAAPAPAAPAKPSIAVLPFRLIGAAGPYAAIADALPHELISELARLRWLFVIARASSFRFRSADPDMGEVGAALNVRYCLSGAVEIEGDRIAVTVELADTRDGGVLWGERFASRLEGVDGVRREIAASVIAALEIQIPVHEAQKARLKSPENLDAWAAYHIGLQHLYRFNARDNDAAAAMFERAVALEPGFARAHAGLSSARFQDAFVRYKDDLAAARRSARAHAEKAVALDPLDPFANFVMGRVYWLEGDIGGGGAWLDRAVRQSPNYAQGIYARGWTDAIAGRSAGARERIDLALSLSPLDPFRYAMLGVRAFAHVTDGDFREAARIAGEAARTPGAHVLIAMIAAAAHEANGEREMAAHWAANVRARLPGVSRKEFFTAFPFEHEPTRQRFSAALEKLGF